MGIIMDGNGRWAQQQGMPRAKGHEAGTRNIRRISEKAHELGVKVLTLYAFSTENWTRPGWEVRALMRIFGETVRKEKQTILENNIQLHVIGRLEGIPAALRSEILSVVEDSAGNDGLKLNVAFNYGGRAEILDAVKRMLRDSVDPDSVTEELFGRYLYTAELPDPDLVIRTAGEMRLSNFLIWQAAYSEYYSTPILWPDFDQKEFEEAIHSYAQRQRKFGGIAS
ncbi:MAG TPA: polyprenyl diphosphate synthase [Chloroflexota bacterium]|nr:polyprenyl diphosphate synthase [Chloroflexota bacterium]